jgi:hypothetical protein
LRYTLFKLISSLSFSENLPDESKIQITAQIVQDVLAAAVDSSSLLPNRSKVNKEGGKGGYFWM